MEMWKILSQNIEAKLHALGGTMAPVTFTLPDGQRVQPFQISDWAERPEAASLPPVMRHLRGDFACVPFGASAPPPSAPDAWKSLFSPNPAFTETHGVCANHDWSLVDQQPTSLTIGIDYPETHPVRRVEKQITLDDAASAVDVELRIYARQAERIAVGVHPVLAIGKEPGGVEIEAPFQFGRTFPGDYLPGVSRFARDAPFATLGEIPMQGGGTANANSLPLPFNSEEVIQLCGAEGRFRLKRRAPAYVLEFRWDAEKFPSLLLGLANGGRKDAPFDGNWYALYVEAVASAFGIGSTIASNPENPIAQKGVRTWIELVPETPWVTQYGFKVTA